MALKPSNNIRTKLKEFVFQDAHRQLINPKITPYRQAWVEDFLGESRQLFGIMQLHPSVFGTFPRVDYVSSAITWQLNYRKIDYTCMPTRSELPGGTKKPWPQKGSGRARHGSVNSPIFLKGGWAKGPRGPVTAYKLMPHFTLVNALTSMFSIKLAQNDLKIVDTIENYSSDDPVQLEKSLEERGWGPSVLIVDKTDRFPTALVEATSSINHINLMSTVGINTLSLAKHETVVVTHDAIREIESRILYQLLRTDLCETKVKYRD